MIRKNPKINKYAVFICLTIIANFLLTTACLTLLAVGFIKKNTTAPAPSDSELCESLIKSYKLDLRDELNLRK